MISYPPKTRLQGRQTGSDKTHKPVVISPPILCYEEKVGALEEYFIDDVPTNKSLKLPLFCSRKKGVFECEASAFDHHEDSKTSKIPWSRILLCNHQGHPLLLPHTRYQERRTQTLKIRTGPEKSENRRTNQVRAGAFPITSNRGTVSQ